jgi:CRP-like cAMP-binding protein
VLVNSKRTASIRARTYCDIYVLKKKDLAKVTSSYPEQESSMFEMAETRLLKDSLRNLLPKLNVSRVREAKRQH